MYLRYDFPKSERPKPEEQKKFVIRLLKENKINYTTEPITGKYQETIRYDYRVNDKCFKHFEFDNKNIAKMIFAIHAWRDIASEMKDTCETIFVHDEDTVATPEFKNAINMLRESAAKVYNYAEALALISKLSISHKSSVT